MSTEEYTKNYKLSKETISELKQAIDLIMSGLVREESLLKEIVDRSEFGAGMYVRGVLSAVHALIIGTIFSEEDALMQLSKILPKDHFGAILEDILKDK